jgi:hypothetical protein
MSEHTDKLTRPRLLYQYSRSYAPKSLELLITLSFVSKTSISVGQSIKLECLSLTILHYLQIALHLSIDHYQIPSEVSRLSRSQGAL